MEIQWLNNNAGSIMMLVPFLLLCVLVYLFMYEMSKAKPDKDFIEVHEKEEEELN